MTHTILALLFLSLGSCEGSTQLKEEHTHPLENTEMKIAEKKIVQAVREGNIEEVQTALKKGINVNTTDEKKRSLLLIATANKDLDMARLLVSNGADVNQQDDIQDSPFLYAGAEGQVELLKLYLANGARFDIFNRYRGSALIPACERGHVETVRLLANTKDFPIDHINRLGWTGLLEAVILGNGSQKYVDIVEILIEAGSDPSIADADGITPLQHAKNRNYTAIVEVLNNKHKK